MRRLVDGIVNVADDRMRDNGIKGRILLITSQHREMPRNLAHYSATTNETLALEILRHKDEVILAIRHVQEFYEPHQQFFELLALWFIRTLHRQTVRRQRFWDNGG